MMPSVDKKVTAVLGGLTLAGWYLILAVLWGIFFAARLFEEQLADIDVDPPLLLQWILRSAAWGRSGWGLGFLAILALASAVYYAAAPRRWSTIIALTILGAIPITYMLAVVIALLVVWIQIR